MNHASKTAAALSLLLAACASTPKPDVELERARAAVHSAEADPNVSRFASMDLSRARDELGMAEAAAGKHKKDELAQHAYLATQNARIAKLTAQAKADDEHVANGQVERDRIRLEARTREAQLAKSDAAVAMAQRDELKSQLDQMKATQTQRGITMTLGGDVLFDTGRSRLKSGASRRIDEVAQFLKQHPRRQVQIEGFTDSVGSEALNDELSERRAEAVKQELVDRGIDAQRINTRGYGKAFPVATNGTAAGRQLNRRVEVVIGNSDDAGISPRTAGTL